jgi:acyl carrier protein phosphodiesterase
VNYLAHLYLSSGNKDLMIGNFIADHVKGNAINNFSDEIISGIKLHRLIDEFTDHHPIVEKSKIRLRTEFRKYAPVIIDIFYDHYLARDWETYHHQPLLTFAEETYSLLNSNHDKLPERTKHMLNYMIPQNWLYNYSKVEGISRALVGLSRRTTFESGMERSPEFLVKDYEAYNDEFKIFFDELRLFVATI